MALWELKAGELPSGKVMKDLLKKVMFMLRSEGNRRGEVCPKAQC